MGMVGFCRLFGPFNEVTKTGADPEAVTLPVFPECLED
jgi:hypothetical protein